MTDRTFSGRLFGPGLPGSGTPAVGSWGEGGELRVSLPGVTEPDIVADHPEIGAGGFNASGVRISWSHPDGPHAFVVDGESDRTACLAAAPHAVADKLAAAAGIRSRVERRFRFGGILLALLLALPFLGVAVFLLHSDRVADWGVAHIPPEQEAKLGDLVLAQTRLQMSIIDSGPAVDAVRAIGSKLTAGSVHRYRWFVADRPDINAFAAPGGVVVVFSGLINAAETPEELAGVLAHEVAHAELRHSLRLMVKSLGLRALVSLIIGDSSAAVFTDSAARLTELHFSREAEREADDDGLRRMVAARIDPNGMVRFYEKLATERRPTPPPILSTHPATGERLERLRTRVAALKEQWSPLPVDLAPLKNTLR